MPNRQVLMAMKAKPMIKTTRLPKLLALTAAVLLTGCSMIPTYERPGAPIATSFPAYGSSGSAV